MRTHTALHVLCGVIWNEWRVPVTGGNMEPLSARMDFEFDPLPEGFGPRVEELVNAELAADRPIEVSFLPAVEAPCSTRTSSARRCASSPSRCTEIRVVDIVGLDKQADGGTHVRSTGEVGRIRVVKTESKGKGNKRIRLEVVDALTPGRANLDVAPRPAPRATTASSSPTPAAPTRRSSPSSPTRRSRDRMVAVTAVSPSLAGAERADCRRASPRERGFRARRGRDRRDGERRLPRQRRRPLLLVQGRADGRARPDRRRARRRGGGRARRQPRRPRRPPARAVARPPARGAVFPLVDAGFTKADVRAGVAASSGCGPGTSRRPPCLASRVPYGTAVDVAAARPRSSGPRRRCAPSASASCACATAATPPASRCRSPTSTGCVAGREPRSWPRCRPPATGWVTLDLEGLRSRQPQRRPLGGRLDTWGCRVGRPRSRSGRRCGGRRGARRSGRGRAAASRHGRTTSIPPASGDVVGDRQEQRPGVGVGVARAEDRLDLECGAARCRGSTHQQWYTTPSKTERARILTVGSPGGGAGPALERPDDRRRDPAAVERAVVAGCTGSPSTVQQSRRCA